MPPLARLLSAVRAGSDEVVQIASASVGLPQPARVQLKVDTGLSRNGARGGQWPELVEAAAAEQAAGRIIHTGTWSHFACADQPDHPANDAQEAAFMEALDALAASGLEPGMRHLANSAATIARPSSDSGVAPLARATDAALAACSFASRSARMSIALPHSASSNSRS